MLAYPPLPRRTPRDQVRASAHSGHLTGQAPPPLLTHTAQQRGEPGAGFLQGPPGIPHPGEGPWNNPPPTSVSAPPGHQPQQGPLPLHASQQRGGPLAKLATGPLDTQNPGEFPLANWGAHGPDIASAHPGHQLDSVSAHPGQQPHQGPPQMHASQQRGGPLAKCSQGPPDIHNPRGEPLANWAAHCSDPTSAHPGHQPDAVSAYPGQQAPQGPPYLHVSQKRGGTPGKNFAGAPG